MVEGTGLENRQRGNSFASSNLALSANLLFCRSCVIFRCSVPLGIDIKEFNQIYG